MALMHERADKQCVCKDCGGQFTFAVDEQEQYAAQGRLHCPSRCPQCREARARHKPEGSAQRAAHQVICARCGTRTRVPFVPRTQKPVYCRACFLEMRSR
jgi:CxxC-x17-CxxC domain-containing protein